MINTCIGCSNWIELTRALDYVCVQCMVSHIWLQDLKALAAILASPLWSFPEDLCEDCRALHNLQLEYREREGLR